MGTTRFSGAILYAGKGNRKFYEGMPQGISTDYVDIYDDFTGVAVDSTNAWTVVKDSGASVGIVADTSGGEIAITSAATTDDDGGSIQLNETVLPAAGRTIWFECRVKAADVTQHEFNIGLTQNFATNPEAMLTASNRIVFQSNDGSAALLCKSEVADTETSTDSGVVLENATYVKLAFKVTGLSKIDYFVNDTLVATHTTAAIPTTELAVGAYSLSGVDTGTKSMTIDYIRCIHSR